MSGRRSGAGLVAEREIREYARSRSFRITTIILLIASVAAVTLPAVFGGDGSDTTDVAVAGGPPGLTDAIAAAGTGVGLELRARGIGSPGAAEAAVADESVDAAVVVSGESAARVVVRSELPDDLGAAISQGLSLARVRAALGGAGVTPARVDELTSPPAVDVSVIDPDRSPPSGDTGIGVLVAVVLYVALLLAGTMVASGVAEEKTSRVSEVLLASLRPIDLLVGKVAGIGLMSLAQLLVAAAPALIAALAIGAVDLPDATASALGWGLVWFVAGYALYAAAYGALGALVGRQQEVGQVTAPLAMLLLAGYLAGAYAASEPDATLAATLSFLPPLSPLVMPARIAAGAVGPGEIVLALALTLASAAAILALGARIYRAGIVQTGARISLRTALRGASPRGA
ncbi:MAG: ABC transporter permease [Thermoleophilia bacterium]|nr:ABC transporter permease [Thermoleophilia bacterium]